MPERRLLGRTESANGPVVHVSEYHPSDYPNTDDLQSLGLDHKNPLERRHYVHGWSGPEIRCDKVTVRPVITISIKKA